MDINIYIEKQKLYHKKAPQEGAYIVSDSVNYLRCVFNFSDDWAGFDKTVIFKNTQGVAYSVLLEENTCIVPYEVLQDRCFKISAFGLASGVRITTNEITIPYDKSGYCEGQTPGENPKTVYELVLDKLKKIGTLLRLTTKNKETLVDAINELNDTKTDKSDWELLEEITTEEELSAITRTINGYGISDISAVMLLCQYPIDENGVKYGIHNLINYSTEYEKPVNIFSWKPTLGTSKSYYWLMVNKESGFVAQSSAATKAFDAAFSGSSALFSAMPIKEITQVNINSYSESGVTKAIPTGSVFRIYGKGVVRNA